MSCFTHFHDNTIVSLSFVKYCIFRQFDMINKHDCMLLDCERKPEHLDETHTDLGKTCKFHTKTFTHHMGIKSRTPLFWDEPLSYHSTQTIITLTTATKSLICFVFFLFVLELIWECTVIIFRYLEIICIP